MAVITFMSDFGTEDYYAAAVRAKIFSRSPNQMVVDISHEVKPFDILHAANILKNSYYEFPKGSVHLVAIDSMKKRSAPIAMRLDGHFFVGFNSGLFSLISSKKPEMICEIWSPDDKILTFPAKDVLAEAALKLAQGDDLNNIGSPLKNYTELIAQQVKATKKEIVGHVIDIDRYGNLMTNIDKSTFEKILELNDNCTYQIVFGRESTNELNSYYTDVEPGESYVFFNSQKVLQIGINTGKAHQLLGIKIGAQVYINFDQNDTKDR